MITLQPHRFAELGQRPYDISGYTAVQFLTPGPSDTEIPTTLLYQNAHDCFPPNTKGYLYFNRVTDTPPPFDCDIRFRVCDNHSTFVEGHDLQSRVHNAIEPWSLPLHHVVANRQKKGRLLGLRHLLEEEKLVDPDVVTDLSQLPYYRSCRILHTLDQLFVLDLSCGTPTLTLMTHHIYARFSLGHLLREERSKGSGIADHQYPYTGKYYVVLDSHRIDSTTYFNQQE